MEAAAVGAADAFERRHGSVWGTVRRDGDGWAAVAGYRNRHYGLEREWRERHGSREGAQRAIWRMKREARAEGRAMREQAERDARELGGQLALFA